MRPPTNSPNFSTDPLKATGVNSLGPSANFADLPNVGLCAKQTNHRDPASPLNRPLINDHNRRVGGDASQAISFLRDVGARDYDSFLLGLLFRARWRRLFRIRFSCLSAAEHQHESHGEAKCRANGIRVLEGMDFHGVHLPRWFGIATRFFARSCAERKGRLLGEPASSEERCQNFLLRAT